MNDNKEKILFFEREIDSNKKTIEECEFRILECNKILERIKREEIRGPICPFCKEKLIVLHKNNIMVINHHCAYVNIKDMSVVEFDAIVNKHKKRDKKIND